MKNKIRELLYEKKAFRAGYWINMVRFKSKEEILETLRLMMYALTVLEINNDDMWYLLGESCEQAFYQLSLSGDPILKHEASILGIALIRNEGKERVRLARDVYMSTLKDGSEKIRREIIDAISVHDEFPSLVIDSTMYGLYDGNINEKNYEIIVEMIYHFRHIKDMLDVIAEELMSIFTIIEKDAVLLDSPMALELFKLTRRPIFISLNEE